MWFRRLFRRRRPPPPVLLPSLERLAELIERVVELLDEVALGPPREPAQSVAPAPDPGPDPAPTPNPGPVGATVTCCSSPGRTAIGCWSGMDRRPLAETCSSVEGERLQRAAVRALAAAGRLAALCVPREGGTAAGGSNLRPVKEESQIQDMRAALQGDRERAEQARQRSVENVRALYETPAAGARAGAPGRRPEPRRSFLSRLLGR